MTEPNVETTPKVAFASRSQRTNLGKVEDLEKEIEALELENSAPASAPQEEAEAQEEVVKTEGLSKDEEGNWKKRYSDLRKHMATKEKEWSQRLEDLEKKAQVAPSVLPKTKAEIEQWVKKFPDIARIVKGIAKEESEATGQEIGSRVKELEKLKEQISLEKAKNDLLKRHPDFDEISQTTEFIEWVDTAPKWVQTAIYDDLDVDSAASAIELYKYKNGIKPKNNDKQAAAAVKTRSMTTPIDDESKAWLSESKVQKMQAHEYEKREAEILAAMQSGKFIYDMSGSRR